MPSILYQVCSAVIAFGGILPFDSCPEQGFIHSFVNTSPSVVESVQSIFGDADDTIIEVNKWLDEDFIIRHLDWSYRDHFLITTAKIPNTNPSQYCFAHIGWREDQSEYLSPECYAPFNDEDMFYSSNAFGVFFEGGSEFEGTQAYALFRKNPEDSSNRRLEETGIGFGWYFNRLKGGLTPRRRLQVVPGSTRSQWIHDFAFHPKSTSPSNAIAFAIDQQGHLIRVVADFENDSVFDEDIGVMPMPTSLEHITGEDNIFASVWFGSGNDYLFATAPDGTIIRWEVPVETVNVSSIDTGIVYISELFPNVNNDGATCYIPRDLDLPTTTVRPRRSTTTTRSVQQTDDECDNEPDCCCGAVVPCPCQACRPCCAQC